MSLCQFAAGRLVSVAGCAENWQKTAYKSSSHSFTSYVIMCSISMDCQTVCNNITFMLSLQKVNVTIMSCHNGIIPVIILHQNNTFSQQSSFSVSLVCGDM